MLPQTITLKMEHRIFTLDALSSMNYESLRCTFIFHTISEASVFLENLLQLNGAKQIITPQCEVRVRIKDPSLTMILCAPIEKQDKGNVGQKGLSDNTKVTFGATKDHG